MENEKKIVWRAAEREHHDHTREWYLIFGGIAVVLLVVSIFQKNFFFGVFVVIGVFTLLMFHKEIPHIREYALGKEIITIDAITYHYEDFTRFAVRERKDTLDEIVLYHVSKINPPLRLPIDHVLAEKVRAALKEKLEEIEYDESLTDVMKDIFKL